MDEHALGAAPTGTGLVLGASRGIGAAVVARLASQSTAIHAAARTTASTSAHPSNVVQHVVDATDHRQVDELLTRIGAIDWLVHCVGVGYYAPLDGDYTAAWTDILHTNVLSVAHVLSLTASKHPVPTVVIVSSLAAHQLSTTPGNDVYGAAKAAVRALVYGHRRSTRTRLCCVSPGYVTGTGFGDQFFEHAPTAAFDLYAGRASMGADDVAAAIQFSLAAPPWVEVSDMILNAITPSGTR